MAIYAICIFFETVILLKNLTEEFLLAPFFFFFGQNVQIERDTLGKLQCHPYPHEYIDTTKQCAHCAFFMGLQRKQGETIQEGQQFDIRGSVDEFRHSINMYMFWKPGMEIYVSHVRRRQIPSYVFPDGYRRPRTSRPMIQKTDKPSAEDERYQNGSGKRYHKQNQGTGVLDNEVCSPEKQCIDPQWQSSISPEIIDRKMSSVSPDLKRKKDSDALNDKLSTPGKRLCTSPQQDSSISPEFIVHNQGTLSHLEKLPDVLDNELGTQQPNPISTKIVSTEHLPSMVEMSAENNKMPQSDIMLWENLVFNTASMGTDCVKEVSRLETDKSPNVELIAPETEAGCTSTSSVITNIASEGSSCEDVGFEMGTGTGSSQGSVQASNGSGSRRGDSCEADSEQLLQNGFVKGSVVFKDGSQHALEVLDLSSLPILFVLSFFGFLFVVFGFCCLTFRSSTSYFLKFN